MSERTLFLGVVDLSEMKVKSLNLACTDPRYFADRFLVSSKSAPEITYSSKILPEVSQEM